MRTSALLLSAVVLLAGCGSDSSKSSSSPATCTCPGGSCNADGVCVIDDSDGGTAPVCDASAKPVGTSALLERVQKLGTFKVGETVAFDVPANTASVTIVEQAISAPDYVVLASGQTFKVDNTAVPLMVKDPDGNVVYDDNQQIPDDLSSLLAYYGGASPSTGTFTIPNTTAGLAMVGPSGLPAGPWSMIVSDYAYECTNPAASPLPSDLSCPTGATDESTYDVTVITKPTEAGAIPATGTLDVAIYFVVATAEDSSGTDRELSAAAAASDPDLGRMATTLRTIFSNAGVTVGSITYKDLPESVRAAYATGVNVDEAGACGELSQLLKLAEAGNTLNIFFVSSFQATGLAENQLIVGIDGTIPGPSTIGGTIASGAAVTTHDLRFGSAHCNGDPNLDCGADLTAYIIAHEAGHFLGLYHVTESGGTLFDPLDDSAPCPCSTCKAASATDRCSDAIPPPATNTEHQMTVTECTASTSCSGGANLMFWLLDSQGSLGILTPQQQAVIRANPLVQ
ncbi:MAG: hypothetical protein A2V77_02730 [Anaeromyxobacter sp. RBG_16_69_14]|nr:MAG: hypothetical protein A2V77_02730 [Anaeromyxobacter sp. RBG_16_69_14]